MEQLARTSQLMDPVVPCRKLKTSYCRRRTNSRTASLADVISMTFVKQHETMGFRDKGNSELIGCDAGEVYGLRKSLGIVPVYKMVDTCAA